MSLPSTCRGTLKGLKARWIQGNLSFAAVLHREFVACFSMFSTVCALSGYRALHGVVFKAAIFL